MKNVTLPRMDFKNIKDIAQEKILIAIYNSAIFNNLPFVFWKHPNSSQISCIVSLSEVKNRKIYFENQEPCFVFSPFLNNNSQQNYILEQDIFFNLESKEINLKSNLSNKKEKFIEYFNKNLDSPKFEKWFTSGEKNNDKSFSKNEFCELVENAVSNIKSKNTKKIVVSRKFEVKLNNKFNPVEIFEKLSKKYNNAFISLISIPDIGTWVGATPEVLMQISENQISTMALAGTQPKPSDNNISHISWDKKEIEEQRFVSEYIRECFKKSEADNFIEENPKTSDAGKFVHLRSLFYYNSDNVKSVANKFLQYMHPTPAICGLPKEKALEFLAKNEYYQREFYSGFLGPVNINNQSSLFVNLRCMQLKEDNAIIYVGCGITEDSVPEKEWYETELKSQILLSVINNDI